MDNFVKDNAKVGLLIYSFRSFDKYIIITTASLKSSVYGSISCK